MHSCGLLVSEQRLKKKNYNGSTVKFDRKIHNEDIPDGQKDCTQNTEVLNFISTK